MFYSLEYIEGDGEGEGEQSASYFCNVVNNGAHRYHLENKELLYRDGCQEDGSKKFQVRLKSADDPLEKFV